MAVTTLLLLDLCIGLCIFDHGHVLPSSTFVLHQSYNDSRSTRSFIGTRIQYYNNSSATFQLRLLIAGDINPNPGPDENQSPSPPITECKPKRGTYTRETLLNLKNNSYLPSTVWQRVKTLGIQNAKATRRGTRGGRNKQRIISVVVSQRPPIIAHPEPLRNTHILRKSDFVPLESHTATRFATWNAQAIRTKTASVINIVISRKIDILAITETWLCGDTRDLRALANLRNSLTDFDLYHRPRIGRSGGGVCFIIKKGFKAKPRQQ